jgi:two-component system, cell cycle response regulator
VAVLDQGLPQPGPARRDRQPGEPTVPMQHPGRHLDDHADPPEGEASLVKLHESIAELLASRGQWQQAYEHLRHALTLATADRAPRVPEQFRLEVAKLRREHAEAREQSIRDTLTASYNRRYLDQKLLEEVEQSGGGLAVALIDLDWFKSVNDTYGHLIGDRVLRQVVELLQVALPDGGFCARYGGEEFVLMLPGVDASTAITVAESARARVEQFPWSTIVRGLRVTVSIGVAHRPASAGSGLAHPEQQLRHADGLLYTAKQSGRNAVAYRVGGEVRLSGRRAAGHGEVQQPAAVR